MILGQTEWFFGSADNNNGIPSFSLGITLEDNIYYRNDDQHKVFDNHNIIKEKIYNVDVEKNNIQINDVKYNSEMNLLSSKQNYSSYIFARHQLYPFNSYSCFIGKIFSCNIYEDNICIRNFIPCYCTTTVIDVNNKQCESGTIGMYDLVEGKFYTNQGTGEFLKGKDI